MNKLYDYIFHFNHYTNLWNAIPRDLYVKYWDNDDIDGVLKSKSMDTLISLIERGDSFIKKIR